MEHLAPRGAILTEMTSEPHFRLFVSLDEPDQQTVIGLAVRLPKASFMKKKRGCLYVSNRLEEYAPLTIEGIRKSRNLLPPGS